MQGQTSKAMRITILVYAILWGLYGLLHVIAPELMQAKDPAVERVLGAAMVALAIGAELAYLGRTWDRVRIMVLLQVIWMILYALTMAWGILVGGIPTAAWPPTIIGVAFAILLAILYVREERIQT